MTTQLQIGGMMCAACAGHVTKALQAVPGVQRVQVQNHPDLATVEHDGADVGTLIAAIEEEGYTAKPVAARTSGAAI